MIYLDACLIIYLLEDAQRGPAVAAAMSRAGGDRFAVSPLVKAECVVGPLKRGDLVLERNYLDLFDRLESLEISEAVFLQAVRIRAQFGLRTPDALHLACAQHYRCTALWTNDDRFVRASYGLAVNLLKAKF